MPASSCSQCFPRLPQVSATTYNEGSSRSHTILRLTIESSERPDPDAPPSQHVARTLSVLNLIDLAGTHINIQAACCGAVLHITLLPGRHPHLLLVLCGRLIRPHLRGRPSSGAVYDPHDLSKILDHAHRAPNSAVGGAASGMKPVITPMLRQYCASGSSLAHRKPEALPEAPNDGLHSLCSDFKRPGLQAQSQHEHL